MIEALQILLKYGNPSRPTTCDHDVLTVCDIDPAVVSDEDQKRLDDLGFFVVTNYGEKQFQSFRFGSA